MVDKRTVTIGVTINLGNYESLRVEVSDIAEDEGAVRELVDFLGQTLDEFGVQDTVTRAAVERYKERVLERDAPEDLESGYFPMEEVPLIHPVDEEGRRSPRISWRIQGSSSPKSQRRMIRLRSRPKIRKHRRSMKENLSVRNAGFRYPKCSVTSPIFLWGRHSVKNV